MDTPDGRYDSRPWNDPRSNPYAPKPNETAPEALVTDRLLAVLQNPDTEPRVVPDQVMFRTRMGYRTRELGISDIVNIDDILGDGRVNFSGGPDLISGTSRNDLGSV